MIVKRSGTDLYYISIETKPHTRARGEKKTQNVLNIYMKHHKEKDYI